MEGAIEPAQDDNAAGSSGATQQEALNDRLRKLINRSEVMLFMKGTPDVSACQSALLPQLRCGVHAYVYIVICPNVSKPQNVRCGFSRQAVELLRTEGIPFDWFDILSDNEVREGLKVFSEWPTYPQLYVRGELMGGLDIMKELQVLFIDSEMLGRTCFSYRTVMTAFSGGPGSRLAGRPAWHCSVGEAPSAADQPRASHAVHEGHS